eukprot:gene22854-35025_t
MSVNVKRQADLRVNGAEDAQEFEVERADEESIPLPVLKGTMLFTCEIVSLLQSWSGALRVQVSTRCLWVLVDETNLSPIQPISPAAQRFIEKPKDLKLSLEDLEHIHLFRYRSKQRAVQFSFTDGTTVLLAFATRDEAVGIMKLITRQIHPRPSSLKTLAPPKTPVAELKKSKLAERWIRRDISNFEYLMSLNHLASRSFNDLAQYPVMPWVLADYESKELDLHDEKTYRDLSVPVGCLGTDGRRDPSRVAELEASAADVKELVPEFFFQPEAFVNGNEVDFGTRQRDGASVADVELPPWAANAHEFVRVQREALESEYVSQNLHHWIDLIFGYKQSGPEARAAVNVHHPYSHEHVTAGIEEAADNYQAVLSHMDNFGQTPVQLFTRPHPSRAPSMHHRWVNPFRAQACNPLSFQEQHPIFVGKAIVKVHIASDRLTAVSSTGSVSVHPLTLPPPMTEGDTARKFPSSGSLTIETA